MIKICCLSLLVTCQAALGQTRLFVEAAITRSNFAPGRSTSNSSYRTTVEPIATGFGSVSLERALSARWQLSTGLSFTTKGAHMIRNDYSTTDERKVFINYISVPVDIGYQISTAKNDRFWANLGLYGAFAISGVEKGTYKFGTDPTSIVYNNIKIRSNNPDQISPTNVVPIDWGLQGSLFCELHRIRLGINYCIGLKGVLTNPTLYDRQYFNRNVSVILGYQVLTFRRKDNMILRR